MNGLSFSRLHDEPPRAAAMSVDDAAHGADRRERWPATRDEFAALVDAYAERLLRFAIRQVGNVQDAEDIVQEVFAKAFTRPQHNPVMSVGAYLHRSVANACTDHLRRSSRSLAYCQEVGIDELLASNQGPAEVAQAVDDAHRADRLLKHLPPEQAEAIRLRVLDGLRLNEIAELLDCSINTVCSRLRYGFQKLRSLASEKE